LLGAAGVLLDRPGLRAGGFAAAPTARGARVVLRSVLDPKAAGRATAPYAPELVDEGPAGAVAFADLRGLGPALGRLLALAGRSPDGLGGFLARARGELRRAGGGLDRRLQALVAGETSVTITPGAPAPRLTLVARVRDEEAARRTLADLQAPLARLFAPPAAGGGIAPVFEQARVEGVDASRLRLTPGLELDLAVFDGRAVLSTGLGGIRAARRPGARLTAGPAWERVLADRPEKVTSLLFLDFRQLLALGEQTGLGDNRAYQGVRRDLARVRAVGVTSTGDPDETTVQMELEIA
jgi:hypothetical protein